MTRWLRDIGICLVVGFAMQITGIGALFWALISTGLAMFVLPFLAAVVVGAWALDRMERPAGAAWGWPVTSAAIGLCLCVVFNAADARGLIP